MIRAAETHVKDAEEHAARPPENTPNLQAAMRINSADSGSEEDRHPSLHVPAMTNSTPRLTEYQSKSRAEMPRFKHSLDMTDGAMFAQEQVAGKPLEQASTSWAVFAARRRLRFCESRPRRRSVGISCLGLWAQPGSAGPVRSWPAHRSSIRRRRRGGSDAGPDVQQRDLSTAMRSRRLSHPRDPDIRDEHNVRLQDFYSFVTACPFVPLAVRLIFAKGLYAGFNFDFIVSTQPV